MSAVNWENKSREAGDSLQTQGERPQYFRPPVISDESAEIGDSPLAGEILENMPSVMSRAVIYLISFALIGFFLFAWFGKTDVVVKGYGKLIKKGDAALVQPVNRGFLHKLYVKQGDRVEKGDIMAELHQSDHFMEALTAIKRARLSYDNAIMEANKIFPGMFKAMKSSVENKKLNLANKRRQLTASRKDLERAKENLALYKTMFKEGLASKIKLLEEQKRYEEAIMKVDSNKVAVNTAETSLEEASIKYKTNQLQYNAKTSQAKKNYALSLSKFKSVLGVMGINLDESGIETSIFSPEGVLKGRAGNFEKVKAPLTGIVTFAMLKTPGQMAKAGDTVFTINPEYQPLVAKVMIPNKKIGLVRVGLRAKIKADPFPYQNYGLIKGTVIEISPDSKEVKNKGFFYEAIIALEKDYVMKNEKEYRLITGMTLVSEIVVEKRRIIAQIIDPFKKLWVK